MGCRVFIFTYYEFIRNNQMTDETFISEKTGKRYKLVISRDDLNDYIIREIIEPKIENTDWVQYVDDRGQTAGMFEVREEHGKSLAYVLEIRKASGEVWKRINGDWVRL
jgi:hypothetical protein